MATMTSSDKTAVELATVFYPAIKICGKTLYDQFMSKTLCKDGTVISCTYNFHTKRTVMLVRKGFEKGVYRQRIQEPRPLGDLIASNSMAATVWDTIAYRIWLKTRMGADLLDADAHRLFVTAREHADYLYVTAASLLKGGPAEGPSAETLAETPEETPAEPACLPPCPGTGPTERPQAAEAETPEETAPRFAAYLLFEFKTGRAFYEDAVDTGGHFKLKDGREFDKSDYIGKPLDGEDEL